MSYKTKSIETLHEELKSGQIKANELIQEAISEAKKYQKDYNFFVTIDENATYEGPIDNMLAGIPCAIKDNLSTKGMLSTASSNTLKDYIPIFDATAVEKLKEAGAVNIGKTVMDELGMGSTGTTAHTGIVYNPWDRKRMCGGSSSGSAAAVAAGIVPYALGSDTGDSIRKPAAYCGIVGYKPTYGLVSRFGLFAFASSLDHVGVLTRNVKDAAIVIDNIKGQDEKDMTSINLDQSLYQALDKKVAGKKLCYIKEICNIDEYENPSKELKESLTLFQKTLDKAKALGIKVEEVSIDKTLLSAIFPSYLCISCAEATSNDSNLTGILFGPRGTGKSVNQIMKDHRTKGFSPLIKRRFVIGSYVLQQENQEKYFKNAQRIRRLIVNKVNSLFEKYDGLILPCSAGSAPLLNQDNEEQISTNDILENHMAIGNFGGFPSITIPNGFVNDLPIGINITGKVLDDANVLNIAYAIESTMNYKNQIAKENTK